MKRSGFDWELWTFLCAIVLANTLFVGAIAQNWLPMGLYAMGRFLLLGLVLAVVVVAFRGLDAGLQLVRPMSVWRVSPKWYLLALLWAPAICVISVLLMNAATGTTGLRISDFLLHQPRIILTVIIGSFIGEIVWVSYAINRLSGRFSVLEASLIVGAFWTLWWVPIVIIGIGVIPGLPLAGLLLNMLAVALMCGFVYAHTHSGLVVLILQIMLNSSLLVFPVVPTTGGIAVYWVFGVVYLVAALLMHVLFGPRPLLSVGRQAPLGQTRMP